MSVYIDKKYIGSISFKLEQFKQKKTDLYNFRCPYCGDSKKNRTKTRGFLYRKLNGYFFICHNCSKSTTFANFLQFLDPQEYKTYAFEKYTEGKGVHSPVKTPEIIPVQYANVAQRLAASAGLSDAKKVSELPEDHPAKQYILGRKIPVESLDRVYYTDNFKHFLDKNFPNHGKEKLPSDARLLLFYRSKTGEITNVAGRALSSDGIRYITIKITEDKKLFGWERVNINERVYVLEGQFDSLFVPNSVASGDSNLIGAIDVLNANDVVLVYDNEPRNKEIVKQISRAIDGGFSVCLFPEDAKGKDINEMIQNGMSVDDVVKMITNNTYKDLSAKLRFVTWKKA